MRSVCLFLVLLCLGVIGAEAAVGEGTPLEEAQRLNQQAVELYQAGRYQEALPLQQRALEIHEKILGPEHPKIAVSLNNLAGMYEALGAYDKALPLYQRALAIREKALGPEHLDTANSLNNLAILYQAMGGPWVALLHIKSCRPSRQARRIRSLRFATTGSNWS